MSTVLFHYANEKGVNWRCRKVLQGNRNMTTFEKQIEGIYQPVVAYRYKNINQALGVPYVSWLNLLHCGGYLDDRHYLQMAVIEDKKPYSSFSYRKNCYSLEYIERELLELTDLYDPSLITLGSERPENKYYHCYYLCKSGCLNDFYDFHSVFALYHQLGVIINAENKQKILNMATYCLDQFSKPLIYDYANPEDMAAWIVTGLLLGYPIESTASLINKMTTWYD